MKKIVITLWAAIIFDCMYGQVPTQSPYPNTPTAANDINKYNFYIDSVNSLNEQSQTFTAASTNSTPSQSISLTGVTTGVHQLYVKVVDVTGKPSIFSIGNFYLEGDNLYPNTPASPVDINKYSFYIDSVTNVNELVQNFAAASSNSTPSQVISLTGVTTGVHQLYAKVTATDGKPSIINLGNFYMEGTNLYQNTPTVAVDINKYSFYIDSITNTNELVQNFAAASTNSISGQTISLSGVNSGVHQLYAKVTATDGKPSIINLGNFYMEGDNLYRNTPPVANLINRYEFFIDSVTNVNIQPLAFTDANSNTIPSNTIDLTNVLPGTHQLYARVFDINNIPSIVNVRSFLMEQNYRYQNSNVAAPTLQNMEYYIDDDPGFGNGTAITIPGTNITETLSNISIAIPTTLPAGIHYFHIRSKQNPWSIDNAVAFDVIVTTPVTWQYVRAQLQNTNALVSWATATETNTDKFIVEWSTDGLSFTAIAEVRAAGNSSTTNNYHTTHYNIANGFNYYRIKQVDRDGSFRNSVIVKVLYNKNIKETMIAPNPVANVINIVEPNTRYILAAELYDNKGALVLRKTINETIQVFGVPVNNLTSGNYVLKIIYKNDSKSYTIIKQ